MANYKTHSALNILLFLPLAVAGDYFFFHPSHLQLGVFAGAFLYGTLFMSPDLDLAHQIKLFSLRGVLTFPFRMYSRVFSHRGISHSLLFGTCTRLVWLGLLGLLVMFVVYSFNPDFSSFLSFVKKHQLVLLQAFAGVFLADAAHLLVDKVS